MGRGRGIIFGMALVAIAALFLALNWAFPDALSGRDSKINLINGVVIVSLLAAGIFSGVNSSASLLLKQAVTWIGVFLVVIAAYAYRSDFSELLSRVGGELTPTAPRPAAPGTVKLLAMQNGHFSTTATVDGRRITFLIDTGATYVTLAPQDARRLGFAMDRLNFSLPVSTANGLSYVAPVNLRVVKVGDIAIGDVKAVVQREGLDQSLLGMSFLGRLKSYSVDRNVLTLTR